MYRLAFKYSRDVGDRSNPFAGGYGTPEYDTRAAAVRHGVEEFGWSDSDIYSYAIYDGTVRVTTWHPLRDFRNNPDLESLSSSITSSSTGATTMAASRTAFQFIVLEHSDPIRTAQGDDATPDSKVVVEATTVLAKDDAHVRLIAGSKIPEGVNLKNVEIRIRQF